MKTGQRFGKVTLLHGTRRHVCEWTLHEDKSLAVGVHGGHRFAMKRLLDVAPNADLDRLAREIGMELIERG